MVVRFFDLLVAVNSLHHDDADGANQDNHLIPLFVLEAKPHQELAKVILSDTFAYTPIGIAPIISFDEFFIAGINEGRHQIGVLGEFGFQDRAHDIELNLIPIGSEFQLGPSTLCVAGSVNAADVGPVLGIEALGRLIGMFSTGEAHVPDPHVHNPKVAEEAVRTTE